MNSFTEDLYTAGTDAAYDRVCKQLLAHKEILARILVY